MPFIDITSYGGAGNGITDNATPLQNALAALSAYGGTIYFPPGRYLFRAKVNYTVAALNNITILGDGIDTTTLFWPNAEGLEFTVATPNAAVNGTIHVRDVTFETGRSNVGNGLTLSAAPGASQGRAASSIERVAFRGNEYVSNNNSCWANGLQISISNVDVISCTFTGSVSPRLGRGILITSQSATLDAVVINVLCSEFVAVDYGLVFANRVQGVTVNQSIFVNCNYGIANTPNAADLLQLTVSASHFDCYNSGILLNTRVQSTLITSNFFLTNNGTHGINMFRAQAFSIVGNSFLPNSSTGGTGIRVGQTNGEGGVITGNNFSGQGTAIVLDANCVSANVQSNSYFSVAVPVQNLGSGNTLGGGSL